MARPDPALLNPARYPFTCTISPRFGDLDVNQHINNAALVTILEDARVRFHHASGFVSGLSGLAAMVASLAIEYLGQGYYADPLTIHVAALKLGNTSYIMRQLVRQAGRTVATAEAVMVIVGKDGPAPIPPSFRDGVQPWMLRP